MSKTGRPYILTLDLHSKIKSFYLTGFSVDKRVARMITDFQSLLVQKIGELIPPGSEVVTIDMVTLAQEILVKASSVFRPRLRDALVVSTCPEITGPVCGFHLEINRIVDFSGKGIGHGPRPGFPTLHQQFDSIALLADNRPVVLVEDGSFQGETLDYVVAELQQRGVKVDLLVIGFAFPKCVELLQARGVEVATCRDIPDPIDWMPDHDFLPFVAGCGKVVGLKLNGECYPFYTQDGNTLSIPYIFPYCPTMKDWVGLNLATPDQLKWLSQEAHNYSTKIFAQLESQRRGQAILMCDLMSVRPPISFPHVAGEQYVQGVATRRVVDSLDKFGARIW